MKKKRKRGPVPETLKAEGVDWKDALRHLLRKKKPEDGWLDKAEKPKKNRQGSCLGGEIGRRALLRRGTQLGVPRTRGWPSGRPGSNPGRGIAVPQRLDERSFRLLPASCRSAAARPVGSASLPPSTPPFFARQLRKTVPRRASIQRYLREHGPANVGTRRQHVDGRTRGVLTLGGLRVA